MFIINGISKVIKGTARAFMTPIMDGTGLVAVEVYDNKGRVVGSTLVKEERTVITTRVPV